MGNSHQQTLPPDFNDNTHPALSSSTYDSTQNQLQISIYSLLLLSAWRHNLHPIATYHKHMFLPVAFRQNQFQVPKCCSKTGSQNSPIKVCYQPFIYTLKNEIIARKLNNRHFREHQIWKVIKCCTLALRDWEYAYPQLLIGVIHPQNLVINSSGLIKLVTKFSWPAEDQTPIFWVYCPPQNRKNAIIRYTLSKNSKSNPNTLSSIYSLGVTVLDMVSLHQAQMSTMPTRDKKKILDDSSLYNKDLKELVLGMTEDDMNLRPSLLNVQLAIKQYKQMSKNKEEKA